MVIQRVGKVAAFWLQKTKIPARGLKTRDYRIGKRKHLPASKNQNPREGIEKNYYPSCLCLCKTDPSKNQNPREGIENSLQKDIVAEGRAIPSKNQNPREGIEIGYTPNPTPNRQTQ